MNPKRPRPVSGAAPSPRRTALLALAAAALLPAALLRADTVIVKSGAGTLPPIEANIQSVENGDLVYVSTTSGNTTKKPLDSVYQIKSTNEPKLTAAEQAFVDGKWADAVTGYEAALNSSQADWVKTRAVLRLIEAAGKSGQFGPQVTAFAELAKRDPASAKKHPPDYKGIKADQINAAIEVVDRARKSATKKETADLLTEYEANLDLAVGKTDEAGKLLGTAAPPAAAGSAAAAAAPGAPGAAAGASPDLVLGRVKVAMAQKNYPAVISDIDGNKTAFTDPQQQADALYYRAQARYQLAGNDPQKLQDAAIDFMRLVTHFQGKPDPLGTNVPAALLAVGEIEERLKQPAEAKQVYTQIANDARLKGTPAAQKAQERLNALK